jgi:hypothetical protein
MQRLRQRVVRRTDARSVAQLLGAKVIDLAAHLRVEKLERSVLLMQRCRIILESGAA